MRLDVASCKRKVALVLGCSSLQQDVYWHSFNMLDDNIGERAQRLPSESTISRYPFRAPMPKVDKTKSFM